MFDNFASINRISATTNLMYSRNLYKLLTHGRITLNNRTTFNLLKYCFSAFLPTYQYDNHNQYHQ